MRPNNPRNAVPDISVEINVKKFQVQFYVDGKLARKRKIGALNLQLLFLQFDTIHDF